MRCAESLRLQAYFDAEVDAVAAVHIERHIEHCAECRSLLEDLEHVRGMLRRDAEYSSAAPALRAKLLDALAQEDAAAPAGPAREAPLPPECASPNPHARPWRGVRPFWAGALGGIGGTAIAATLAFMLFVPRLTNPLLDELVSAHVRSLMPAHLIDVASTDKHTVKPWFAGHADVSPVVADFESQGYRLIGGRTDFLDHQHSAVVVYQHGAHVINVFSWAGGEGRLPNDATRSGYHLAFWRVGDLDYCAVSDTGWDELQGLVRLLRESGTRGSPNGVPRQPERNSRE